MLIVLDGVYSAGKSTLIELLARRIAEEADTPVVTDWNSSELVGDLIPQWKRDGRLGAYSLLFAEATDLAHRCEKVIRPRLAAGETVIADRYVLSGMARALIRGADRSLVEAAFGFAPRESLTVLVECPARTTLERRTRLGKVIDGYHSGRDYRRGPSAEEDFVEYQETMARLYRGLAPARGRRIYVDTTAVTPEAGVEAIMACVRPLREAVGAAS
jgi:thymidylate kinase